MAYDDSYPTSESEIIVTNCEPVNLLNGQKDPDYVNDWVDLTVENEIWRGKKLREEKPLPDRSQRECNVIDINFLASFCKDNQFRARKGYSKPKKDKTRPSTPRSTCPCPRPNSATSTYSHRISRTNTGRNKTKNLRKCSMRIAELAVPTKRQCIDTWRNKSYILPELMVDRLKQHVMDQRPIVKITDALYCFERKRPKSSKKVCENKNINDEVLKPYNQMDSRMLCIIFGHKIAKILSKPLNLTLNSDLEKLSNIVASDIAQMISKSRCVSKQINAKHRQKESIHKDVSDKITVWIAGILEDLSLKLLEEDLRASKEKEANSKFAEQFIIAMEKILQQAQREKYTDLEEEEGPVLDFIDDLVDNVMNICEPLPLPIDEESDTSDQSQDDIVGKENEKPLTINESLETKITTVDPNLDRDSANNSTEEFNDLEENENLTDTAHFRNEIWNLIHNVKKQSWENVSDSSANEIVKENSKGMPTEEEEINENSGENSDKLDNDSLNLIQIDENTDKIDYDLASVTQNDENTDKIDHDSTNLIQNDENTDKIDHDSTDLIKNKENVDKIDHDSTSFIQNDKNTQKIDSNSTHDIQNNEIDSDTTNVMQNGEQSENDNAIHNDEKNYSNVSEVFEIFTEDSGDEKNSKKVKFSVTDLVNPNKTTEEFKRHTSELPETDELEQTQWNSSSSNENVKSNIVFAEPNEHLLSDADESWPPELTEKTILKISNSVSKSVTSLGNILETDEKQITPIESETNISDRENTGDTRHQSKIIINKDTNTNPTEKYDIGSQTNEASKQEFNESITAASETITIIGDFNKVEDNNINKSVIVTQTYEDSYEVDGEALSKREKHQTNLEESSLMKIENSKNIDGTTEGDVIQSHKTRSLIDYGWKVHPKTAPAWVTSWGHGRGEPSEDSIPVEIKPTKVKESDMRKWCKDLEKAFVNLEMWKNWIENTCKETVMVLKQKEIACPALNRKGATNWIRLKKNIHKDAILWTKLHLRTEDNFKNLKRKYNNVEYSSNKAPTTNVQTEIFQTMHEFENLSVLLHEMIVTAEYCAICTCNKTKIRKNMNMEAYLRNITE